MARHRHAFIESVGQVLDRGSLLLGPELAEFERAFAHFAGGAQCVGVASGASALQLSLAALGIGPGDEVILPAMTAVPTAAAVQAVGATPVFVDVELATAAIDAVAARAALTERTRAVIGVHLYGRPFDVAALSAAVGVPVVEDSAQAHGATGSVAGAAAAYSFYPTKNLGGVGDGGAVVTDDLELADRVRRLRVHGMSEQYVHVEISQNHRISELEAAWLRLTLPFLAADNERRRAIVAAYRAAAPQLAWHADHPSHVYHLAVVRSSDRDALRRHLEAHGVRTAVHYPLALTQQPAYAHFTTGPCPNAEAWSAGCVSVPCFPELTDDEVATVCAALNGAPA
jgi:dTDP-4-amino-4,6-dideoxygalactose transaminase